MVTEAELKEALELALNSVLCFCGNHKRMDKPLCFQCWDSLPGNWKQTKWTERTPEAYAAACEWLIKHYPGRFPTNVVAHSQCQDKTP